jgi:hypothetical protein
LAQFQPKTSVCLNIFQSFIYYQVPRSTKSPEQLVKTALASYQPLAAQWQYNFWNKISISLYSIICSVVGYIIKVVHVQKKLILFTVLIFTILTDRQVLILNGIYALS